MERCPICELNYIQSDEEACQQCRPSDSVKASSNTAGRYDRLLNTMGQSWFVSYLYFTKIDKSHRNWEIADSNWRIAAFEKSTDSHQQYLKDIKSSLSARHETNQLGLSYEDLKKMVAELLNATY